MAKRRDARHSSCSSVTPYSRPSPKKHPRSLEKAGDNDGYEMVKEWEEAMCPICMDHPHNAVLLRCPFREKGCRPYICNTGVRHSDCLTKFYQAAPESTYTDEAGHQKCYSMASCPLCRGRISGWDVVDTAGRRHMDSKPRSCSCSTCNFSGSFAELRKHVRAEHPLVSPREVDPSMEQKWRSLVQERDTGDMLAALEQPLLLGVQGDLSRPTPAEIAALLGNLLTQSLQTGARVLIVEGRLRLGSQVEIQGGPSETTSSASSEESSS